MPPILLKTLKRDPIYDAAASDFIEALDICEPLSNNTHYRRVVQTANRRSAEKSIFLTIASLTFRGRRCGPKDAIRLIEQEKDPLVKSILVHRLFGEHHAAPYKISDCKTLLQSEIKGTDGDLARYCASLWMINYHEHNLGPWMPGKEANHSVKLMMKGLGFRKRAPSKQGILDTYFKTQLKIFVPIPWKKALQRDFRDAENRCLNLQKLQVGNPSARILILDTFNEVLVQAFSQKHPLVSAPYRRAAGHALHPDFGNWLNHPDLAGILPKGIQWFREVHKTRVEADLAHAKIKKGKKKGVPTKPVTFKKAEALMRQAKMAWAELIIEWKNFL